MNKNKQLVINMAASFLVYLVNFGISFFLSPYIVGKIGVEAYGFIGLANNFVAYAGLITIALNSLAGRFVTIKIYEKDMEGANRYFSSVFYANLILTGVMALLMAVVWIFLEYLIQIPHHIFWDVKTLFAILFANCLLGTIGSVFGVATFATNKLYLSSLRQIEANLLRVAFLLTAFLLFVPKISYLGIASVLITGYVLLFNIYYTKKLTPELSIERKMFDWKSVWELITSGVWNLINRLGQLLLEGLDLLISNVFISAAAMGTLSLAKAIPNVITGIIGTLVGIFSPNFTILYAEKKTDELVASVKQSMKIMGIITNLPIIILIVCGDLFFSLWQPTQNAMQLHILSVLTCVCFIVSGAINSIYNVFTVVNKLKLNSVLVIVTGVLNAGIVYVLLRTTQLGIYAIAGVSSCLSIIRNLVFTLPYGAHCLNQKWYVFFPAMIKPFVFAVLGCCLGYGLRMFFVIDNWTTLIIFILLLGAAVLLLGSFVILNQQERKQIWKLLRRK